jgi:hypothetical protein
MSVALWCTRKRKRSVVNPALHRVSGNLSLSRLWFILQAVQMLKQQDEAQTRLIKQVQDRVAALEQRFGSGSSPSSA